MVSRKWGTQEGESTAEGPRESPEPGSSLLCSRSVRGVGWGWGKYSRAEAMDFLFDALAGSGEGKPHQPTELEASCPGEDEEWKTF